MGDACGPRPVDLANDVRRGGSRFDNDATCGKAAA
jgi:hypothetical protein